MTDLHDVLAASVANGSVPGAVGLVARGDHIEVQAVGFVDLEGTAAMSRDTIFRIASITKPVTAAAVMMLADDGRIAMDQPIAHWLPELASPVVVRTPDGPVDDVVAAARPITVFDLLTFRAGWGFPSDFTLPVIGELFKEIQKDGRHPQLFPGPGEWIASLSRIPLVHQPGDAWLYNTCSDIQGVLIARVSGQPFPEFVAERLFGPLGMVDTGFDVPASKLDRFTSYYEVGSGGGLELADGTDGQWTKPPTFPSGAGGLVSTADDWLAFARMLLAEGTVGDRRLLSAASVRHMTTNHLTSSQRDASRLFLEGQGWGFGGSVDVEAIDPWNVPGRYGWVGGTGTAGHLTPSTGAVTILLTQAGMTGPAPTPLMRDFWRCAAGRP